MINPWIEYPAGYLSIFVVFLPLGAQRLRKVRNDIQCFQYHILRPLRILWRTLRLVFSTISL